MLYWKFTSASLWDERGKGKEFLEKLENQFVHNSLPIPALTLPPLVLAILAFLENL